MTGFHIGNHRVGDGSRDWDGFIDDVAVYYLELSSKQIQALVLGRHGGSYIHAGNVLKGVPQQAAQNLVKRRQTLNLRYHYGTDYNHKDLLSAM